MDEHQASEAGRAFAAAHLDVIEGAHGRDVAIAYAAGYVVAATRLFLKRCPVGYVFDYFWDTAFSIMDWQNQRERAGEM